jgi:ZU5 domain
MNCTIRKVAIGLVAVVAVTAGCSDGATPMEPFNSARIQIPNALRSLSSATEVVKVLERTTALESDIVRSEVIGQAGGVINLPETGLRLIVPEGAVSVPTVMSVRALAGALVAYSFEPHGLKFALPLTVEQSLLETKVPDGSQVTARGYSSSDSNIDWENARAEVPQVGRVERQQSAGSIRFEVTNFSGYLVSID